MRRKINGITTSRINACIQIPIGDLCTRSVWRILLISNIYWNLDWIHNTFHCGLLERSSIYVALWFYLKCLFWKFVAKKILHITVWLLNCMPEDLYAWRSCTLKKCDCLNLKIIARTFCFVMINLDERVYGRMDATVNNQVIQWIMYTHTTF